MLNYQIYHKEDENKSKILKIGILKYLWTFDCLCEINFLKILFC